MYNQQGCAPREAVARPLLSSPWPAWTLRVLHCTEVLSQGQWRVEGSGSHLHCLLWWLKQNHRPVNAVCQGTAPGLASLRAAKALWSWSCWWQVSVADRTLPGQCCCSRLLAWLFLQGKREWQLPQPGVISRLSSLQMDVLVNQTNLLYSQAIFCSFILLSCCSLFQTLLFCGWPINLSPQPLPSLLSFSCAQHFSLLPGLLVRLPPQLRCLPAALVACWPFLGLDFRVHFCVSNIHFYLEGFNTLVSFCRTAHLNVVSSTSLPSSLVIAGFWALQPWRSVRTSLSLHTALPFSSWEKKNLYFFSEASPWVPVSLAEHWICSPACPCQSSLASSCSCLFSWYLAFQADQLVASKLAAFICLYNITCWQFKNNSAVSSVPEHEPGATPSLGHLFIR